MSRLDRQARFVASYLIDLDGQAAAIRVGYSKRSAKQIASALLAKPEIAAAVAAGNAVIIGKAELTAERVLGELEMIGFMTVGEHEDGRAGLLSVKRAALVDLGKHLNLFKTSVPGDSADNPLHATIRMPDPIAVNAIVEHFMRPKR